MKAIWTGFHSVLSDGIEQFIAHKRTLGRRYATNSNEPA